MLTPRLRQSTRTGILEGRKRAVMEAYSKSFTSLHGLWCLLGDEIAKDYKPFIPLLRETIAKGGTSRILTNVEKESLYAIRELAENGAEIRHIDASQLRRCVIFDDSIAYFSVIEPEIELGAHNSVFETEGYDLWVSSSEPSVIESAKRRFMKDWHEAKTAEERIKEIEEGRIIQVIKDQQDAINMHKTLIKRATDEVLFVLPSVKSFQQELKPEGALQFFLNEKEHTNVKLKILCPIDQENQNLIEQMKNTSPNVEIRNNYETTFSILLVDRKEVITQEHRAEGNTYDVNTIPNQDRSGLSTYSNSRATVESYGTLFYSLWKEKEMLEELEKYNKDLHVLNEQLRQQDKIKTDFINMASHEIRTPTQVVLGYSKMLARHPEKVQDLIPIIQRNASRLQRLITNVLDTAVIETRSLSLKKEELDLNEVLVSVISDITSTSPVTGGKDQPRISCKQDDSKKIIVRVDKERINQVLYNLLSNAMKYARKNIELEVTPNQNDQVVSIMVKDDGPGISPEIQPRLFTKFTSRSEKGTGLGLFLAKNIIEAHGGRIWAEKNSDGGGGATFVFTLPLVHIRQNRVPNVEF